MSAEGTSVPTEVVGLIPAAGVASRLGPIPCSKEILPVGVWDETAGELAGRQKVASHYLLERLRTAGVRTVHVVLREGKWDIPAFLGNGASLGMHLAYHIADVPWGPAYSLDAAYPFVRDRVIATGFPDQVFEPDDAFVHLLAKLDATDADIVLGLFPTSCPSAMDMVELDAEGRIRAIDIKPAETELEYTWIIAVWTPRFTEFMHEYLCDERAKYEREPARAFEDSEAHVGRAIQVALEAEPRVEAVVFPDGSCIDVGTPGSLTEQRKTGC